MSLKNQTFSAVRWTTFSSLIRAGLQVLQVAILARLLAPADFGLIALITSLLAFANMFADLGVSNAIIQRQNITQDELSTLYWLNLGVSGGLMVLLACASPLLAMIYYEPRLKFLLCLAGSVLIINAAGQQLRVNAEKNIRFAELARIEILSSVIGFATTVILAVNGVGVASIVYASIAMSAISTLLAWIKLSDGWRPSAPVRLVHVRKFTAFGMYMIGGSLANMISANADVFIGGRLLGVSALGFYSLPRNLCLQIMFLVNPTVTRVGFPVMSRVQQDQVQLKTIYLKTLRMTASVNFPIYLSIALFATEIVKVLFGDKWVESGDILRALALWGLIRSTANPVGSLLLAVGRADLTFKWTAAVTLVVLPILALGARNGVTGLACGQIAVQVLLFYPVWYFLVRPNCGASFAEYLKPILTPLAACIPATAAGFFFMQAAENPVLRLVFGFGVSVPMYLIMSFLVNREWTAAMMQLLRIDSSRW